MAAYGLTPQLGQQIAAIITFCGNIEFYLEKSLWNLSGFDPEGKPAPREKVPASDQMKLLRDLSSSLPGDHAKLLGLWCDAASDGFMIRHTIAHGLCYRMDDYTVFARNWSFHGETRKRPFDTLWLDQHSAEQIADALGFLLRLIRIYGGRFTKVPPYSRIDPARLLPPAKEAKSLLGELTDKFYNPSFEKY